MTFRRIRLADICWVIPDGRVTREKCHSIGIKGWLTVNPARRTASTRRQSSWLHRHQYNCHMFCVNKWTGSVRSVSKGLPFFKKLSWVWFTNSKGLKSSFNSILLIRVTFTRFLLNERNTYMVKNVNGREDDIVLYFVNVFNVGPKTM